MDQFYKMDVFFFITAIAVVLLTVVVAIVLIYLARILKDIKYITGRAKTEADLMAEDLHELRHNVRQEGAKLKHFGKFFSSIYRRKKK